MATTISAILRSMRDVVEATVPTSGQTSPDDRFRCAIMPTETDEFAINRPRSCVLVCSGPTRVDQNRSISDWQATVVLIVFYAENPPTAGADGAGLVAIQDAEDLGAAIYANANQMGLFNVELAEATTAPTRTLGYFAVMRSITVLYGRTP